MNRREQLTNIDTLSVNNIQFGKHEVYKVQDTDTTYERIPITIQHDKDTFGSLLLKKPKCFSFGAQQNRNKETGELYGWTLPIAMFDRDGATPSQVKWVETFNDITKKCKEYLRDVYLFEDHQLDKLASCMWQPSEESKGPTLYAKIITGKKSVRYDTQFSKVKDLDNSKSKQTRVTKEDIRDYCNVVAVVNIGSIYVSDDKVRLQVKVYEANVQKLEALPSFLK